MKKIIFSLCFVLLTIHAFADEWRKQPGAARDISIGANGDVWVVGNIPGSNGYSIHKWNGTGWNEIDGSATNIAVEPNGNPWVINNLNQIWRREGNRWIQMPGAASDIAIGSNGAKWIIGITNTTDGKNIQFWNAGNWTTVPGGGVSIAVGPNGQPIVATASGAIKERLADGSWFLYPGAAKDVAIGADGSLWVIGMGSRSGSFSIHKWNVSEWQEFDGGGTRIAVDHYGMPYVINHVFEIYKRTFTKPNYAYSRSTIRSIKHNFQYNGRVESLSLNPVNANHIMLASGGGVFETFNAQDEGRTWTNNSDFNNPFITDVLLSGIPSYTYAWAVSYDEFSTSSLPQIWEKKKTGWWGRAEFERGTFSVTGRTAAYRVIHGPDKASFFACGDFGIASFGISGQWSLMRRNFTIPIYSMAILKNGAMVAVSSAGLYVFDQAGDRWRLTNASLRISDASGRFKLNTDFSNSVFLFNDIERSGKIHYSTDGINWNSFASPALPPDAAGGFYSVYMDSLVAGKYSLLVSNKFKFFQADISGTSPANAIAGCNNSNPVTWSAEIKPGHDDTRHFLRFPATASNNKIIMTSDGGVHSSSLDYGAGLRYAWATDNTSSGLNNLDVYNLTGTNQLVNFGTQHNGFGVLNNDFTLKAQGLNEGYLLDRRGFGSIAPRTVLFAPDKRGPTGLRIPGAAVGDPEITVCGGTNNLWKGPDDGWGNPVWMGNRIYIQDAKPVSPTSEIYPWKISFNDGCTWQNLPATNNVRAEANAFLSTNRNATQVLTSSIQTSDGIKLAKLTNPTNPAAAAWSYPAMRSFTGGFHRYGADFYFHPLFAVSTTNSDSIFAVEASTFKLKVSTNGGNDWTEVTSLHNILRDNGAMLKSVKGVNQITAIAFSPYDSQIVLAGTSTAGIYISYTGGSTWMRLIDTGLVNITDFHWKNAVDVVVSTYGHGVYLMRL